MAKRHVKFMYEGKLITESIGFPNHIIIKNKSKNKINKAGIIRLMKSVSLAFSKLGEFDRLIFIDIVDDSIKDKEILFRKNQIKLIFNNNKLKKGEHFLQYRGDIIKWVEDNKKEIKVQSHIKQKKDIKE